MHGLFRYVVLLFSLPVLWLLGLPLFTATWDSLRKGILSTDALLSLGVAASFAVSFLSVLRGERSDLLRGRLRDPGDDDAGPVAGGDGAAEGDLGPRRPREAAARHRPPGRAGRGRGDRAGARPCAGDLLRIRPGERFPADGRVAANWPWSTSRSSPARAGRSSKEPGRGSWGARSTWTASLVVEVRRGQAPEGRSPALVEMVKQARASKGRYQRLVGPDLGLVLPGRGGGRRARVPRLTGPRARSNRASWPAWP